MHYCYIKSQYLLQLVQMLSYRYEILNYDLKLRRCGGGGIEDECFAEEFREKRARCN